MRCSRFLNLQQVVLDRSTIWSLLAGLDLLRKHGNWRSTLISHRKINCLVLFNLLFWTKRQRYSWTLFSFLEGMDAKDSELTWTVYTDRLLLKFSSRMNTLLLSSLLFGVMAINKTAVIQTQYGPVQGMIDPFTNVSQFFGIPFAAPPTGS